MGPTVHGRHELAHPLQRHQIIVEFRVATRLIGGGRTVVPFVAGWMETLAAVAGKASPRLLVGKTHFRPTPKPIDADSSPVIASRRAAYAPRGEHCPDRQ